MFVAESREGIPLSPLLEKITMVVLVDLILEAIDSQIQKELEKRIENRFYQVFEQSQKSRTDFLGFGQYFRHQIPYPELKDWREVYYPKLIVDFQVNANIE
ncbi:Ger(x)C family spore germination C-terminal domain-containing protein [Paenibacillus sp. FJAT-27812]|uniref:Ger(x)C family spore germination C-terminal domain-containing protein n=1 Tax=Paenibacillus sp. FJAT-27812 TaxID=1684143 RepID=UPI0006A760A8|nr:Ger(x)C family spore germination C-terminal domain-containing protein [Paenibacillus sp. FJAT-27812]